MNFEDSFLVPVAPDVAWDALTDIERVYPCLPGAQLEEIRDGEFRGLVRIRIGPITATYDGTARFEELDREHARIVIRAEGRDKHGQGMARARINAILEPAGEGTLVRMENDIEITGKAAQFGRGVLGDISKEMLGVFANNLRAQVTPSPTSDGAPASESASAEPSAVDALALARAVAARRRRTIVMVLISLTLAVLVLRRLLRG